MFDLKAIAEALPLLVKAAQMTLLVSALGLVVGYVLAVGIATARLSSSRMLQRLGAVYVFIFRGVPLIVQLMMAYYFLPFVGINVPPIAASILAISLCEGAYLARYCAADSWAYRKASSRPRSCWDSAV